MLVPSPAPDLSHRISTVRVVYRHRVWRSRRERRRVGGEEGEDVLATAGEFGDVREGSERLNGEGEVGVGGGVNRGR
jgi:hypothetical protein